MERKEQNFQRKILTILFRNYPQGFVFHIPNSGKRSKIEGYNLVLNGLKAGTPDLCIVRPQGRVGWIEVKAGTGLSKVQVSVHNTFRLAGHDVFVVDSEEQLLSIIEKWKEEDGRTP